jgi:uncharacterized protein
MLRRRSHLFVALFGAALVLALGARAEALDVPALRGRVNDYAGLLDPQQASALESKLARYEQETGHQYALLVVPSLEGEAIEPFAVEAFERWKLGDERRDDGLLMVVALRDRRVRVEVGYGLEGAIPDVIAARVIREVIVPSFRAQDYAGGLDRAFDVLMAAGKGEAVGPAMEHGRSERRTGFAPVVFFWLFLVLFSFLGRGRRRGMWMIGGPGGFFMGGGGHRGGGGFGGGGGSSGGGGASGSW